MITATLNDEEVQELLRRMVRRSQNMRPALEEIGQEISERVRQGFSRSQSPYGDSWTALSAVTQAMKNGRRANGKPLLDTGRLRSSSISSTATDSTATIGTTNVAYAATHQFGARQGQYGRTRRNGPIPYGNVPARPFLPIRGTEAVLPAEWQESVVEILTYHITEGDTP